MDPVLPLLAPDQQRYPRQRQTRGGIHRPDNVDPTHGITVIKSGAYLLVLGLTYGRAHYKCARFIENYAIVICIQFLPSAKNLACCQQNLGWEDRKATLTLEQKYVFFEGLDEAATELLFLLFDFTHGNLLRKPATPGTKQNAASQPACLVRSALQMDLSCDELEACFQ